MNRKLEAKIRKEIRRRAFERADSLRQKHQNLKKTQYTLDALQEVTGLPRPHLESIADEVKLSLQVAGDGFFSVKDQVLVAFGVSGFVITLGLLLFMI